MNSWMMDVFGLKVEIPAQCYSGRRFMVQIFGFLPQSKDVWTWVCLSTPLAQCPLGLAQATLKEEAV